MRSSILHSNASISQLRNLDQIAYLSILLISLQNLHHPPRLLLCIPLLTHRVSPTHDFRRSATLIQLLFLYNQNTVVLVNPKLVTSQRRMDSNLLI